MNVNINRKYGILLIPKLTVVIICGWIIGSLGSVEPHDSSKLMDLEQNINDARIQLDQNKAGILSTSAVVQENYDNIVDMEARITVLEKEIKELEKPN
jgi:peptidoglycan hydrolase CwlO-like protein